MPTFNVHISVNKKQTLFLATISNEKKEVIKELAEEVKEFGAKTHHKLLQRRCRDWIQYEYEVPADLSTMTENVSGNNI